MGTEKRERQKAQRQARLDEARAAEQRAERRRRLTFFAVLGVLVAAVLLISVLASSRDDETATSASTTSETNTPPEAGLGGSIDGPTPCPPAGGADERITTFAEAPPMCIDPSQIYVASFDTSEGLIEVALDTTVTPETANNFATLAGYHYYDGTEIFRADPSIEIIQGGAPTNSASDPGPGYTIPDEGGPFTYQPGQLVMARTAQPNSAGAQFFFVAGPAAAGLDSAGTYVVFGEVVSGLDVVQAILALSDGSGQLGGAPSRPVIVNSVTIEELPAGTTVETSSGPDPVEPGS